MNFYGAHVALSSPVVLRLGSVHPVEETLFVTPKKKFSLKNKKKQTNKTNAVVQHLAPQPRPLPRPPPVSRSMRWNRCRDGELRSKRKLGGGGGGGGGRFVIPASGTRRRLCIDGAISIPADASDARHIRRRAPSISAGKKKNNNKIPNEKKSNKMTVTRSSTEKKSKKKIRKKKTKPWHGIQ